MSPRDAYFLYHVFMLQVTCILHKSVVIDAIKIEFVYVRLSNGIVVFIYECPRNNVPARQNFFDFDLVAG